MAVTVGCRFQGEGHTAVGNGGFDRPAGDTCIPGIAVAIAIDIQPFGPADGTRR